MTLATHAIAGAAIASLAPQHPVIGFCAGFASHFALDAIPHYDYPIYSESVHPQIGASLRLDAAFWRDMSDFSLDALAGTAVSLLCFATPASLVAVLAGAAGGMIPDPLQFVYAHFKHEPLITLQRFHKFMHTGRRLREERRLLLGILSQIALIAAIIGSAKYMLLRLTL